MRTRNILAALLLMVAGLQTSWAQGFRIYKSDGTIAQFSMRTDSIVFYEDIGSDVDFGPFMPVNQCIVGTWYKSKSETITFNEDGTTDYIEGATYEFLPYQGTVIFYNASGAPMNILKVYKVTKERMIAASPDGSNIDVWYSTPQKQFVTSIVLSEESFSLLPDDTKTLTATVLPEDADNKTVKWESSDTTIATVDQNGKVTAVAEGECTITVTATDGSGVKTTCSVTVQITQGYTNGYEWVNLGLPSGTLWATCNVGASSPEESGDYFAWGETTTKSSYYWSNYKYGSYMTKYCTADGYGAIDNKIELEPADDAATANWGESWQMPSLTQCQELIDSSYTYTEWANQNGVSGIKITSKSNGKSIFLPAAGFYFGSNGLCNVGRGYYWSRSLQENYPVGGYNLHLGSSGINAASDHRYTGQSVRPVRVQTR